jgi:hypothetical protein
LLPKIQPVGRYLAEKRTSGLANALADRLPKHPLAQ